MSESVQLSPNGILIAASAEVCEPFKIIIKDFQHNSTIKIQIKNMKKVILIAGASSGIGKETARYFAANGWSVIASRNLPGKDSYQNF